MLTISVVAGWIGMLAGIISGSIGGLFFYREEWMGGYTSFRRRMARLGHVSFFGLGFLNLFFATTAPLLHLSGWWLATASISLIVAAVTMPACCFLTAWRAPMRHLFPIPVIASSVGVLAILLGWLTQ